MTHLTRTYGTLALGRHGWVIVTEPHVLLRLKRVFGRVSKGEHARVLLSDTPEIAFELRWFLQRYPLAMDATATRRLETQAAAFEDRQQVLARILAEDYTPPTFPLAVPARQYQAIAAELALRSRGLLVADEVGLGKAQPLSAGVLTPSGWRRIGDLEVGDEVVDPDGGVGSVTGVYPQGERDAFRVTMKDGASTVCCDEHLWGVYSANDRVRGGSMRVLPLHRIASALRGKVSKDGWASSKWFLPISAPVTRLADGHRPIDPYVLGVLIGDGSLTGSIRLTNPDLEIIDRVRERLPDTVRVRSGVRPIDWAISRRLSGPNPILEALRDLGLSGRHSPEKFIPVAYMTAPVDDRLELLRGLMDTDGDCTPGGVSIFNTSSERLRDNVIELVRSLGGIASTYTKPEPTYRHRGETRIGREAYRVNVRMSICPFAFRRKAERWKPSIMARAIHAVEPCGRAEMVCIAVATKRNLYVTDGHIVTHNTAVAIATFTDPSTLPALVVTLTHLPPQWRDELAKFLPGLRVHVLKRGTPYPLPRPMPDVLVSNYHKLHGWAATLVPNDVPPLIRSIVFDEVQELRTGPGKKDKPSLKYSAARHLASAATYRQGLSATPIYNFGDEMFHVLECLAPGALGTHTEFAREWCTGGWAGRGARIAKPREFGRYLREQGLMLRRTRQDVGRELPPVTRIPHHVDADERHLEAVGATAAELARVILGRTNTVRGETMRASSELSYLLRQATGLAKAAYVAAFVRLLVESGERVVIFGWHHAVYEVLGDQLKDFSPAFYTGQESVPQKLESRQRFLDRKTPVLIMSLRAGAGLDGLQQVSRTVVFSELDWSPGVLEQCIGRINRDGQSDPVMAYFLIADTGSDPVMVDVLGLKRQQSEGIRDPDAAFIEKLEVDEDHVRRLAVAYLEQRRAKHAVGPLFADADDVAPQELYRADSAKALR